MSLRLRCAAAITFLLWAGGAHGQSGSPFATNDPFARALTSSNVAVAKTLQEQVSKSALSDLASQAPSDRPLKIGVVTNLPQSGKVFGTGAAYTQALHKYLGLGKGVLIVVVQKSGKVYAATDSLRADEVSQVLNAHAAAIGSDPVAGIDAAARELYAQIGAPMAGQPVSGGQRTIPGEQMPQEQPGSDSSGLLVALLAIAGVVLLIVWAKRSAARSAAMAQARAPIDHLRGEIVTDIAYADTYLDLLPDSPDAQAARAARTKAAELFDQGRHLARHARTPDDLGRAEVVLQQARDEAGICRQYLDRATGGTGYAVAVEGTDYKATPALNGTRAAPIYRDLNIDAIPIRDRAACFFCSRPSDIANLTPVTIALDGQRRKVLACPDDVRIIREGAPPQVRTVSVGGQARPWFAAPGYDPYRDYWVADPVYAAAYWGAEDAMWTGLMLGTMLADPIPYPVYVDGGGMPTADPSAAFGAAPEAPDLGGAGSADIFGDAGGSDFGGADTSSADFGSGDPGASDFGSTDFGSTDFGGGADLGGGSDVGGGDFGGGGGDSF